MAREVFLALRMVLMEGMGGEMVAIQVLLIGPAHCKLGGHVHDYACVHGHGHGHVCGRGHVDGRGHDVRANVFRESGRENANAIQVPNASGRDHDRGHGERVQMPRDLPG